MLETAGLAFLTTVAPMMASAQALTKAVGTFNVFVGLMLTASILVFGTGFVVWSVRLGTWPTYRTEGVRIMEWGVVILFVLVVILAIVQFFQSHARAAAYIVSTIVLILVAAAILVMAAKGEKKKEERRPPSQQGFP